MLYLKVKTKSKGGADKVKYSLKNFEETKNRINSMDIKNRARKSPENFTRNRKLPPELILYILNRRGLTTKMELVDFIKEAKIPEVNDVALLKQREKLNAEVFKYLNEESMKTFYNEYEKEVKTFKGYILTAIDGSDWEIPNSSKTREEYKAQKGRCARMKVSTIFDILNCFVLDTEIEENNYSELKLAARHLTKPKN